MKLHAVIGKGLDRPWVVACAVFALLLLGNAPVLMDPPYWDGIVGYFTQAVWLAHHSFDLVDLAGQTSWSHGGPLVYSYYSVPVVVAVLLQIVPLPGVFVVLHLANLAGAALVFCVFFSMLRRWLPTTDALFWCVAALLEPVFSGQTAAIYLELPVTAGMALALHFFLRRRMAVSFLVALGAFTLKQTISVFALAVGAWLVLRAILKKTGVLPNSREQQRGWLLAFGVAGLFGSLAAVQPGSYSSGGWQPERLIDAAWRLIPSQSFLLLLIVALALAGLARRSWRRELWGESGAGPLRFFLSIFVGGFWLSFALFPNVLVRYSTFIIFPMFALCALMLDVLIPRLGRPLALGLILLSSVNQYGALLPDLPASVARSGQYLERSREYLLDLESTRRFVRQVESRYAKRSIVSFYPFTQMLRIPEMGYVQQALPNVIAGDGRPAGGAAVLDPEGPADPQWLYIFSPVTTAYWQSPGQLAERGAMELIYAETSLDAPLILYRHVANKALQLKSDAER